MQMREKKRKMGVSIDSIKQVQPVADCLYEQLHQEKSFLEPMGRYVEFQKSVSKTVENRQGTETHLCC